MPRTANLVWLVKNGSRPHGAAPRCRRRSSRLFAPNRFFVAAASTDAIAAEVGYEDGATLRTLLRDRLGRGAATFERICVSASPNPSDISADNTVSLRMSAIEVEADKGSTLLDISQ
jgi:hypothetical protein